MMIIVWLAVVVVVGVAAIDAGSIAFTKFRLADVASTASTPAANAYRSSHEYRGRVPGGARPPSRPDDASAKLAKKGCVVNPATGTVTITVRKDAKTILAAKLSFTKKYTKVSATETNGPTAL